MSSAFDKDSGFEEEATDAYQGASKMSDDDEDEADEPSVEAELAEQESGLLGDNEKKIIKKKVDAQQEDLPKSDLDLIREAEEAMEADREELLAKDGDGDDE